MNIDIENLLLDALAGASDRPTPPDDRSGSWRQAVREFAEREIAPYAAQVDADQRLSMSVVRSLLAEGYLGFLVAPEFGGRGGDIVRYGMLCEELGRACSSARTLLTVHDMVAHAIDRWGTSEQKTRWLPSLATGETLAAFCLTEEAAGSNASAIQTTAESVDGGFVLNGTKKWISFGQIAHLLLVFARSENKPTAFLVDTANPGVRRHPVTGMLGLRGAMLAEVVFDNCFVPRDSLLGRTGFGVSHVATSALQLGRYNVACGSVGIGQACIDLCLRHTAERHQFGVPLKEHQLVQRALADMLVEVRSARLVCNQAGYCLAMNRPDALVLTLEAKYVAARAAMHAAQQAVQLHGARGCHDSSAASRYFRDAKIMEIIEGTNEICQIALARNAGTL